MFGSSSTFTFPEIVDDRNSEDSSPDPSSTDDDHNDLSRVDWALLESMEPLMDFYVGNLNESEIEKIAEAYDFPPPDYSKKNMVQFKKYNKTISFYRSTSTAMVQPLDPDFPCERHCRLRTFTVIIE